jgi:putative SOS response-associated peptidase YedK
VCGRYAAAAQQDELVEEFRIDAVVGPLPPASYNIAPTDPVPAVWTRPRADGAGFERQLTTLRWGLVPSWSRTGTGGARLINARLETVAEKPSFRRALGVRRCLLPALGYYEWYPVADEGGAPRKQPVFLRPEAGPLVMAGLYEFWRDPEGPADEWLRTCTIITTRATDSIGHVHERMPVRVPAGRWDTWLDPGVDGPAALGLLGDHPGTDMVAFDVRPLVNRVGTNGPELIEPLLHGE